MITGNEAGVYLDIQVQPKARRPGIRGVQGDRLKIAVSEPAEDGKANRTVIAALAGLFEVKTASVSIVKGTTTAKKRVFIRGVTTDEVRRLVQPVPTPPSS